MKLETKRRKRETMTRQRRHSTLFQRRIIIPIPTWGVFVMAGAIGLALFTKPMLITNIVSLICVSVAVILVFVARSHVKALRHDVHEALNNINNDDLDDDDTTDPEVIRLKKFKVNGNSSSRVSE